MENSNQLFTDLKSALKRMGINYMDIIEDYRDHLKDLEEKPRELDEISVYGYSERSDDDPIFVDSW